jgi:hypothetical protein
MADSRSWELAVQEAREAERAAYEYAEALRTQTHGRASAALVAPSPERKALIQSYGRALQTMAEKWERAWIEWNLTGRR